MDLIEDNPVSRIPLSCYKSVANVRLDIANNLEKYQSGQVNVVGANNFAAANQKVAKHFAETKAPKVKVTSAGQSKDSRLLANQGMAIITQQKNPGKSTFGTTKRLADDSDTKKIQSAEKKSPRSSTSFSRQQTALASTKLPSRQLTT